MTGKTPAMVSAATEIVIPPRTIRPATLVTARSYLVDRFVPDCEIVHLPARVVAGGTLRLERGPRVARSTPSGRARRLRAGLGRSPRRVADRVVVDLRLRAPDNWAHFLDNHLPIFFRLAREMGLDWDQALLLLPAGIPGHILRAAALFGLETLVTDDPVEGEGVAFAVEPWTAIRPLRVDWVQTPEVQAAVARGTTADTPLPERVFLARSDTRRVANEDEVEAVLALQGYRKIYPETLSVADQFRLFREARRLVAVHGAGLAPLMYLPPGAPLELLVEILPCGHMTDFYRAIADKLDVPWIGVRGRIKPQYVDPAYRFEARFDAFSLDDFEVDVAALERALDFAEAARADPARKVAGLNPR
jgi:capsular polysaccharide biosynthesis protein